MADLRWNPVSVNFNDASALMRNAGDSISKAGTVFGELRKSILDEEQRAIENAYKQQVFDENVRQFAERMGLERDQFAFSKDRCPRCGNCLKQANFYDIIIEYCKSCNGIFFDKLEFENIYLKFLTKQSLWKKIINKIKSLFVK